MKAITHLALLLTVTAASCSSESAHGAETKTTTWSDVNEEASELWQSIKGYSVDRRTEAEAELENMLQKTERDLQQMRTKVASASAAAESEVTKQVNQKIVQLEESRKELALELKQLRDATPEAWGEARDAFVDAFDELQSGLRAAASEYRK